MIFKMTKDDFWSGLVGISTAAFMTSMLNMLVSF